MLCTIERMDRSSPPGVLSCTMRAWAPSACARSIAFASRRTVTGVMAESSSISETGAAAEAGPAMGSSAAQASRMAPATRRGRWMADLTPSS